MRSMESNKIIVKEGTGVTSCLSVRLHDVFKYKNVNGRFPKQVDSSQQFSFYRDKAEEDISARVFGEYKMPPDTLLNTEFDHGWQYAWYDKIDIIHLSEAAALICPLSDHIGNKAYEMKKLIKGRTAILYRGNDKALEIPRTNYQAMIEMAIDSKSESFIVQTDEQEFYEFFKERFPDTVCFSELPRISKDPDRYVMPAIGQRVEFACTFLAALSAIASCEKLILNTGNTGLWAILYRGHTQNVWQVHPNHQTWRKLK